MGPGESEALFSGPFPPIAHPLRFPIALCLAVTSFLMNLVERREDRSRLREEAPGRRREKQVAGVHFQIGQEAWCKSMNISDPEIQGRGETGNMPAPTPQTFRDLHRCHFPG